MNSIITHKLISAKSSFAGREWFYPFYELPNRLDEKKCALASQKLAARCALITKVWTQETNSEWLCRIYFSAKMILSATLNLNAVEYAKEKNLRMVVPYLRYYALLSLARGVIYTLPEIDWEDGNIFQSSHSKTKKYAATYLANFDQKLSNEFEDFFSELKAGRELISYRAPSKGDALIGYSDDKDWMFVFLAELIQLNSEVMEASILKNSSEESHAFLPNYMKFLSEIEVEDHSFFDKEDAYRLGYLKRKHPLPPNVLHIMTEGHVEDFFGAWSPEDELEGLFDPDIDWQKIFGVP